MIVFQGVVLLAIQTKAGLNTTADRVNDSGWYWVHVIIVLQMGGKV